MSNPGVIYLSWRKTKHRGSFRVEDNIGEAIHVHYENLRIDLSTAEFLKISEVIEESLEKLIDVPGFRIKNYDPAFLSSIGAYLYNLQEVRFEKISLSELQIVRKGIFGLPVVSKLYSSRVVSALMGDSKENNSYAQNNFYGQTNRERITSVKEKILESGYPHNDEYIVVFNNQNLIRDGQHRASILLNEGKIDIVPIIRLIFTNNKHNASLHPWFKGILSEIKNVMKGIYRILRKIVRKLRK